MSNLCPKYAQDVKYTRRTLLIHIQVVAGEAGEYDVVYSLPKEGRWTQMVMMMMMMASTMTRKSIMVMMVMMMMMMVSTLFLRRAGWHTDGDEIDDDDGVYFLPKEDMCLLTNKFYKVKTVNFQIQDVDPSLWLWHPR